MENRESIGYLKYAFSKEIESDGKKCIFRRFHAPHKFRKVPLLGPYRSKV